MSHLSESQQANDPDFQNRVRAALSAKSLEIYQSAVPSELDVRIASKIGDQGQLYYRKLAYLVACSGIDDTSTDEEMDTVIDALWRKSIAYTVGALT